jgi:hypothetical protein
LQGMAQPQFSPTGNCTKASPRSWEPISPQVQTDTESHTICYQDQYKKWEHTLGNYSSFTLPGNYFTNYQSAVDWRYFSLTFTTNSWEMMHQRKQCVFYRPSIYTGAWICSHWADLGLLVFWLPFCIQEAYVVRQGVNKTKDPNPLSTPSSNPILLMINLKRKVHPFCWL